MVKMREVNESISFVMDELVVIWRGEEREL